MMVLAGVTYSEHNDISFILKIITEARIQVVNIYYFSFALFVSELKIKKNCKGRATLCRSGALCENDVCSKCVTVLGRQKDTCAVSVSLCWEGGRTRVQ